MSLYEVNYNGLTINDTSPYVINKQEGVAGLPIRISQNDLTGADGAAIYKTLYGARDIAFEGVIKATTEEEYFENRRELLRAFSRDGLSHTLSIRTWDGNTFYIDAVVTATPIIVDNTGNVTYNKFRVELRAPDPFFRDGEEVTFTAVVVSGGVGFPLPAPVLTPLGLNITGSTIIINNTGDGQVIPEFRLDGEITSAVVTNLTTGESFQIDTTIPDGRFVSVFRRDGDFFVLLDGTTSYYQYFQGNVFPIIPGNNTIRLTAQSAGPNALLTINYQNQRNGI